MLVYIREGEQADIMKEIELESIPKNLQERFNEENEVTLKLDKELSRSGNYGKIYLVSPETVHLWEESGFMQIPDDVYRDSKFDSNPS